MLNTVPNFLYEKLQKQYNEELTNKIIKGYNCKRPITLRVNLLKSNIKKIEQELQNAKIQYKRVSWNEETFILENISKKNIEELSIYENGEIYLQSLSSMLPAIILNPQPEENILDMAAAPGGKTTQIASITLGKSFITACEKNKLRAQRLKYNIEKQGANKVNVLVEDARNLSDYFSFDKILLDSPCSGSGTIYTQNKNLESIFTKDLVERSVKTQKQLLTKAISLLKKGQEMVYSTCSILKEENESQLKEFLQKGNIQIVPIEKEKFKNVPFLPTTIEGTITISPTELYEGFFVAKLRKGM